MKKTKQSKGSTIVKSLTSAQTARLLDVLLKDRDTGSYLNELRQVDEDIAETIEKIMKSGARKKGSRGSLEMKAPHPVSSQKNREIWDELWNRWDERVADVGDEEGRYAVQEEAWEPPYFDGSLLAADLEPFAEKMLGLLDEVFPLVKEPDLFSSALKRIDSHILQYPDWMGAEEFDGCELDRKATQCVLKWEWNATAGEAHRGKTMMLKVHQLCENLNMVSLNKDECIDFFISLPEKECREIYDAFADGGLRNGIFFLV